MPFIEVQTLADGHLIRLNVDHIVKYGPFEKQTGEVAGSTIVLSTPFGFNANTNVSPYVMRVIEKPEVLDKVLNGSGVGVLRTDP